MYDLISQIEICFYRYWKSIYQCKDAKTRLFRDPSAPPGRWKAIHHVFKLNRALYGTTDAP